MSEHEYKRRDSDVGVLAKYLKAAAGVVTSLAVLGGALAWAADTQ